MRAVRRTAPLLVTALALALALSQAGAGLDALVGTTGSARLEAVSRLHDAVPVARLRSADARFNHHRPTLAAVAGGAIAALALLAIGAIELHPYVPVGNVLRRPAAGRGPPR